MRLAASLQEVRTSQCPVRADHKYCDSYRTNDFLNDRNDLSLSTLQVAVVALPSSLFSAQT